MPPHWKETGSQLTKGFTGRLARGIHNRLLEELNESRTEILPYPLQRGLVRNVAIPAEAAGRNSFPPFLLALGDDFPTHASHARLQAQAAHDLLEQ